MEGRGFSPCPQEWWHFTLKNAPYADTYFDFAIEQPAVMEEPSYRRWPGFQVGCPEAVFWWRPM